MRPERSAAPEAWTGVVAGVLFLVAFAIPAPPPSPDAPAAELLAYLQERRGRLLASSCVIAVAAGVYVWFLGTLAAWLGADVRASGARIAVVAAGTMAAAVLTAGGALQAALVLQSAGAGEELVRFGFDAYNALVTVAGAGFGVSVLALAVAAGRAAALPPWLLRSAPVVAALQFATLGGLVTAGGFLAAGGGMALIAFWALVAWHVPVSVLVARGTRAG